LKEKEGRIEEEEVEVNVMYVLLLYTVAAG
jgi:hypothetical protein